MSDRRDQIVEEGIARQEAERVAGQVNQEALRRALEVTLQEYRNEAGPDCE